MKKIIITGKDGQTYVYENETGDLTEALKHEKAYGKPQRWVHEDQCSEQDKLEALQSRVVDNLDAQYTEYELPAEYTIEITDVSVEYAAKEAEAVEDEAEKVTLKAAITLFKNGNANNAQVQRAIAYILKRL